MSCPGQLDLASLELTPQPSELLMIFLGHLVSRIAMVKAEKARAVEDLLIRMAQGGQVRSKITETQLIELLEQVNQQTNKGTKIVVWKGTSLSRLPSLILDLQNSLVPPLLTSCTFLNMQ